MLARAVGLEWARSGLFVGGSSAETSGASTNFVMLDLKRRLPTGRGEERSVTPNTDALQRETRSCLDYKLPLRRGLRELRLISSLK